MDERRSSFEKTYETRKIADRFEGHPIFGGRSSVVGGVSKAPLADFDSDRTQ
uniref:Lasso RiPP family leader peptide-containing protein n=1 Tax=Steinernema glaseri TaxID=37863 RepID=A0A1I7Y6C7_9BILA